MRKLHQLGLSHPNRGRFLTLEAAARHTPMGPDFLASEIRKGRGPAYYQFGVRMFFLLEDIEEWVASKRVAAGKVKSTVCPRCGRSLV